MRISGKLDSVDHGSDAVLDGNSAKQAQCNWNGICFFGLFVICT